MIRPSNMRKIIGEAKVARQIDVTGMGHSSGPSPQVSFAGATSDFSRNFRMADERFSTFPKKQKHRVLPFVQAFVREARRGLACLSVCPSVRPPVNVQTRKYWSLSLRAAERFSTSP